MTSIRKGYCDGAFGQVHYRICGEGTPILLAHQSPSSSEMFTKAYPLLAGHGFQAIGVDTPGFGMSDVPPSPPTVSDFGDALGHVMDHLGLDQAHLLGHHTGAGNVADFAFRNPDRAASVILNGPPIFTAEERAEPRPYLEPMAKQPDGSHLVARWDRRIAATVGWTDIDAMHRGVVWTLVAGDTWWYGHAAAFAYDMEPAFMGLSCPTLILTNTGDDIYHLAQRARDMRPELAYVELEGGTHDIVDEQPEAWAEAVAGFIKSL